MLLITGATGFIGSNILIESLRRGLDVAAFSRRREDPALQALPRERIRVGDLESPDTILAAMEGVDSVIHCAAATSGLSHTPDRAKRVNVTGTEVLLRSASESGVRRWIQISTMSAHAGSTSVYGSTKYRADQLVRASMLDWTILRPSLVFGGADRGLVAKTITIMRQFPLIPVVGTGREKLRPMHVDDLVSAIFLAFDTPGAIGNSYMIGSGSEVTLDDFFRAVAEANGMRKPILHIPLPLAALAARMLGVISDNPPITLDNVLGIRELQRVDIEPARHDFGFQPMTFEESISRAFGERSV